MNNRTAFSFKECMREGMKAEEDYRKSVDDFNKSVSFMTQQQRDMLTLAHLIQLMSPVFNASLMELSNLLERYAYGQVSREALESKFYRPIDKVDFSKQVSNSIVDLCMYYAHYYRIKNIDDHFLLHTADPCSYCNTVLHNTIRSGNILLLRGIFKNVFDTIKLNDNIK